MTMIIDRRLFLGSAAMLGGFSLVGCTSTPTEQRGNEQALVDTATATLTRFKTDAGARATTLLRNARAVLIFPDLVKGGVGVGATRGQGVMLVRAASGWNGPAFYESSSVSVGLQVGLEESAVIMIVNSDRAFNQLMQSSDVTFKVGGGLSLVDFNTARQDQITGADVVVWSRSQGAYGGLTLSGSDISQRMDRDQTYYGKPVNATQIGLGAVSNPQAAALRAAAQS